MISTILDKILGALAIEVDAFAVCEIGADAALLAEPLDFIEIHHVLAGTLHLTIGDEPQCHGPGTLVIVPAHRPQRLAGSAQAARTITAVSAARRRADDMFIVDATMRGGGPAVRVLCGKILADAHGLFGPLDGIDRPIVVDLSGERFVAAALETLLAEIEQPQTYSRTLASALMKACLALALRRHVATGSAGDLPRLFARPWLARAISAVLEVPERSYTVASLAALAGRSRSVFSRDFSAFVGVPPMEFVIRTRLERARHLIETSTLPIAAVARATGFASRSHFTQSFQARYGKGPSALRRSRLTGEPSTANDVACLPTSKASAR